MAVLQSDYPWLTAEHVEAARAYSLQEAAVAELVRDALRGLADLADGRVMDEAELDALLAARSKRAVLFLDIDGVCHPAEACGPMPDGTVFGEDLFCWVGPLLELLQAMPHVDVVLHSSWRHAYRGDLKRLLQDLPPALASRVVGVTPPRILERQASIEAYVRRHRVQHFVAIDDAPYQFDSNLPWLVVCGPDGLSNPATVQRLRQALHVAWRP